MNKNAALKYLQVALIVIACVAVDQWTKHLAQTRLASQRPGHFAHNVLLTVPSEFDGKTVREFVTHEFGDWNSPPEINDILRGVTDDGAVLLRANRTLEAGDVIEVRKRVITVVPGYFDLEYTRNTGAAFSFLADADPSWRVPFFIMVSLVAVLMILWILRGVPFHQQMLVWGLGLIAGGALGNLIDRVRLEYVIDFIVWKWTDQYQWPTFNIADSAIVVGVSLMILEMIRDTLRSRRDGDDTEPVETSE